jgi:hypothetical protein
MGRVARGVAVDAAGMEEDAARLQEERARSLGAILLGRRLLRPLRRAGDEEKKESSAHARSLAQGKTNLNCPSASETDFLARLGVRLADGLRMARVAAQVVEVVVGADLRGSVEARLDGLVEIAEGLVPARRSVVRCRRALPG